MAFRDSNGNPIPKPGAPPGENKPTPKGDRNKPVPRAPDSEHWPANQVRMQGLVEWEPDRRYTQSGQAVTNFALRIPTGHEKFTTVVRCVAWGEKLGNILFAAGTELKVEGTITQRSYEKDGATVYVTEIRVSRMRVTKEAPAPVAPGPSTNPSAPEDDIPF